jgi:hypothetical protein
MLRSPLRPALRRATVAPHEQIVGGPAIPALMLSYSPAQADIGVPYSALPTPVGGVPPYVSYAIVAGALPAGLSLNAGTGEISGTPTGVGLGPGYLVTVNVTIEVTDSAASTAQDVVPIDVAVPVLVAALDPTPLPDGTEGTPYVGDIDATGGLPPYTFTVSAGALPTGTSINASTGEITGTPTTAGTYAFTVEVEDSEGNVDDVADSVDISVMVLDVTDHFLANAYTGNGTDPRLLTGIDLSAGGAFILKSRSFQMPYLGWSDGVEGYAVETDSNIYTPISMPTRFVAGGFNWSSSVIGAAQANHSSGVLYVLETFKKAAGFLDVVHYSGTGVAQDIPHALGKEPAMIIVKRKNGAGPISAYHRDAGNNIALTINGDAFASGVGLWDNTNPDTNSFRVGTPAIQTNNAGYAYAAILFAHDPSGIIQACSWVGDGLPTGPTITLGWQPQFLLVATTETGVGVSRNMYDTARDPGFSTGRRLTYAAQASEVATVDFSLTVDGFTVHHTDGNGLNVAGRLYYAVAVREP